jgi:hypothetical protein
MENVLFTRQRHQADRAGLHWDYRLVVGDIAHSWATKKQLPEEGKSIILWEQPVHTKHYALSKKVNIPAGQYGAGVTTLDWVHKGTAEFEDGKIVVNTKKEGSFLIKKLPENYGQGAWLFKRIGTMKKESSTAISRRIAEKFKGSSKDVLAALKGMARKNAPTASMEYNRENFNKFLDVAGTKPNQSFSFFKEKKHNYLLDDTENTSNKYLNKIAGVYSNIIKETIKNTPNIAPLIEEQMKGTSYAPKRALLNSFKLMINKRVGGSTQEEAAEYVQHHIHPETGRIK